MQYDAVLICVKQRPASGFERFKKLQRRIAWLPLPPAVQPNALTAGLADVGMPNPFD